MGFLDRAIKKGLSGAVSSAIEQSVRTVVQPKVDEAAANVANRTAAQFNSMVGETEAAAQPRTGAADSGEVGKALGTLGGLFGSFQSAAVDMANEAAKNMKLCPACGEGTTADKTYCPSCGAKLPEETVAQGALCSSCGTQNEVGKTFCTACGAKLPAALASEAAFDEQWAQLLPNYPRWTLGGNDPRLEDMGTDDSGEPYYCFSVRGVNAGTLTQYKELLRQNGFRQPVRYSTDEELYKVVNGVSYAVNSSEPFGGDAGELSLYFHIREFDETPEPRRESAPQLGLKDVRKFLKF